MRAASLLESSNRVGHISLRSARAIDLRKEMHRAVVIGPREEVFGLGVIARGLNWLVDPAPSVGDRVGVRVRHRAPIVPAEIVRISADEIELALDQPVRAIAPGQSLVLYDGDRVLGGGFIEASRSARAPLPMAAI